MEPALRKDVPAELTWDLSLIYPTEEKMLEAFGRAKALADAIEQKYKGRLTTAQAILDCLSEYEEFEKIMYLAGSYAELAVSVDYYDTHNQELNAMVNGGLSEEERLFVAQTTVIRQIAARDESCVIMGRCADYVLYEDPNCFRIFIHARPSARIARVMNQYGVSEQEARREMENTDQSRSSHYKHFTGRDYGKQEYYHLGVDSGMLGTEASVDLIVDAIRMWCDVRGTHPLSILETKQ